MWFPKDETLDNSVLLHQIAFTSQSLTSAERHYRNIGREAIGILCGLEKYHHHYFVHEGSIIIDHKPPMAVFGKDVAALSHRLQRILLHIHQYNITIFLNWDVNYL